MSQDLLQRDRAVLWHPYSQHGLGERILPVVSAAGSYLQLEDGQKVIDAISSWWVNIHGHSHPRIAQAIARQASQMEHVIFAGFTHEPAVKLAELLVGATQKAGADLSRVFYSDNGSTAVEVALKMAFQFHHNQGNLKRTRFLALRNSYHGDTLGAMAVGEPEGFHTQFKPLLPSVSFCEPDNFEQLERLIEKEGESFAAFIFEPIVQGASGMRFYSPQYLKRAVELCREKGILSIADEVFTGFYRTGKCFAFEHAGFSPDLLCLSKGITGGFLPLAVTLSSEKIYSAFLSRDIRSAFLHGHSYTANPIACAAALESWKMLQEPDCQERIQRIETRTREHVQALKSHPNVKEARSLGTIGVVELKSADNYFVPGREKILARALRDGVLLRPLGNVIYTVPPYCMTLEELDKVYKTLGGIVDGDV